MIIEPNIYIDGLDIDEIKKQERRFAEESRLYDSTKTVKKEIEAINFVEDLIAKKRQNIELTSSEIEWMIKQYTAKKIPDYQMSAFLMAVVFNDMTKSERLALTQAMVNSGDFTLEQAIYVYANSCERCMNSLLYKYLDGKDGYPEYSEEWKKCNTQCDFCINEGENNNESDKLCYDLILELTKKRHLPKW